MDDMSESDIDRIFQKLVARARTKIEELPDLQIRFDRSLELRYVGQSFEINVPISGDADAALDKDDVLERFHRMHDESYGYSDAAEPVELVNLRVSCFALTPKPNLVRGKHGAAGRADIETTDILTPGRKSRQEYRIIDRFDLGAGTEIEGPCLILSQNSTALVPDGWNGTMDGDGTIQLVKGGAE